MISFYILIITTITVIGTAYLTDTTRNYEAIGEDVVEAIDQLIHNSNIFREDYGFLKELAYIESEYGNDSKTFADKYGQAYYGGIWQVEDGWDGAFSVSKDVTKYPDLFNLYNKINTTFGIDWNQVTWQDCRKPLYSALAARLTIEILSDSNSIPSTPDDQAEFWAYKYNLNIDSKTKEQFLIKLNELQEMNKCVGNIDLVIVLDGSGSIGPINFQTGLDFVANLTGTFNLSEVNIGFIIFSDNSQIIFDLNARLTMDEMKNMALSATYPGSGTNTPDAIRTAVSMLTKPGLRLGIPKIMATFTDGESTYPIDEAIVEARNANISSFAIGIGVAVNLDELLVMAYGDPIHVFQESSYLALSLSFKRYNTELCVPKPDCYELTKEGITVSLQVTTGTVEAFYSYFIQYPNSALNDGIIKCSTYIPVLTTTDPCGHITVLSNKVCLNVIKVDGLADYTISIRIGK